MRYRYLSNTRSRTGRYRVHGGGVTTSKYAAVKVNRLNANVHPQFATVKAIVEGLTQMCGGALPAGYIGLFDNTNTDVQNVISDYRQGN